LHWNFKLDIDTDKFLRILASGRKLFSDYDPIVRKPVNLFNCMYNQEHL
jgi:hypothetical protein